MPYGFLCCGPSAENAVYNSSDEDSSSDERETDAAVSVIHWPHVGDNVPDLPSSSGAAVLPSTVKKVAPRRAVSSRAPPLEESDLMEKMAKGWKGMQTSLERELVALGVGYVSWLFYSVALPVLHNSRKTSHPQSARTAMHRQTDSQTDVFYRRHNIGDVTKNHLSSCIVDKTLVSGWYSRTLMYD